MLVIATKHPVQVLPATTKDGIEFIKPSPGKPVDVEEHPYYLRRITAGELERVKPKGGAKQAAQNEEANQ